MEAVMKKIQILTGHYGCGKTNYAINLAFRYAAQGFKTAIADMDIVNPYFRTADFRDKFKKNNISYAGTAYANTNLDIPAVCFDLEAIICENDYIILDIGGDDAGAVILGSFNYVLKKYTENTDMIYVVNKYRDTYNDIQSAVNLIDSIEKSARMKHTKIVNNSNIGKITAIEDITGSFSFAEKLSDITGIPLLCHTAPAFLKCSALDNITEYVEIYVENIF